MPKESSLTLLSDVAHANEPVGVLNPVEPPPDELLILPRRPISILQTVQLGGTAARDSELLLFSENNAENALRQREFYLGRTAARREQLQPPEAADETLGFRADKSLGSAKALSRGTFERQQNALAGARRTINSLPDDIKFEVNELFDTIATPFFKQLKAGPNGEHVDRNWVEWLGDAAQGADDDQLVNFLQWHEKFVESMASNPQVRSEADRIKDAFRADIIRGKKEGWLVERQGADFDGHAAEVTIRLGDSFDTTFQNRTGYKESNVVGRVTIAIGHGDTALNDTLYYLQRAEKHELSHEVLQDFKRPDPVWKFEAATEFIALAMDHGYVDSFKPFEHGADNDAGSYADPRYLMDAVLNGGGRTIPARMVTRAYSGGDRQNAQLEQAIDKSWGVKYALDHINFHVDSLKATLQAESPHTDPITILCQATKQVRERLLTDPRLIFGQDLPKSVQRKQLRRQSN